MRLILLGLFSSLALLAQGAGPVVNVSVDPTGSCGFPQNLQFNMANQTIWGCGTDGAWHIPNGGGGVIVGVTASGGVQSSGGTTPNISIKPSDGVVTPSAAALIVSNNSTDNATAVGALTNVTIQLPDNTTTVIGPTTMSHNNVTIIGGMNSTIKATAGQTGHIITITGSNVNFICPSFTCIFEANGANSNKYVIKTTNKGVNVQGWTFKNSSPAGSPASGTVTNGIDVFNGSSRIFQNLFSLNGQHVLIDLHNSTANAAWVWNNVSSGSLSIGIQIESSNGNAGQPNPVGYCEVSANFVSSVGDVAGDAGQTGNAITIYQADGCLVHDNTTLATFYSGIRCDSCNAVNIHDNTVNGAGETAIYTEFGGNGGIITHNHILHSQSGINDANSDSSYTQTPDIIDSNDCTDVGFFCVQSVNAIVQNNKADGVPIPFKQGGGTGGIREHDQMVRNNDARWSSTMYAKPIGPSIFYDKSINYGTDFIGSNHTHPWAGYLDPSNAVITAGSYSVAPTCSLSGGSLLTGGFQGTCFVTLGGGGITSISFPNPGAYATVPTITLTGGTGSGGAITMTQLVSHPYIQNADIFPMSTGDGKTLTNIVVASASTLTVTTSGTAPLAGEAGCFANIYMAGPQAPLNGMCGTVSAPSGGNFTVTIDPQYTTSNIGAWTASPTTTKANFFVYYASGGAPKWTIPPTAQLTDMQIPCAALPATPLNGTSLYVPDGTRGSATCGGTGSIDQYVGGTWYYGP